ncbi:MAG: DNA primase [Caldilineaceae bacterium]
MIDSDEIKQRIDIVDYISRYTPLKKSGRQYSGLCPFHTEKTPSFYVYPDQGSWHCYGACSTGGDVISFLMKKEDLTFLEALKILAQETGVDVSRVGDESQAKRQSLYELNDEAAVFFSAMLKDSPQAEHARAYIAARGIDDASVEKFGIGFAPDGWTRLRDHLLERGFDLQTQLTAGVVKHHEERDSYYDAFRNRVIVPIRDRRGRVIGFGGRVLDDSQPKYLNTADSPVFRKSNVVFGINLAYDAIREADRAVIVEGYMDVIAAHQYGFNNVVACMGTALTTEQLRQIQRATRKFVLALDADSAGQQATIRGLNQARRGLDRVSKPVARPGGGVRLEERLGAELFISSMPEGMDPDDVIRQDPEQWKSLVDNAQPLVDYFFKVIEEQYDLSGASGKGAAVSALAPLIAELDDDIAQQHYIQRLSRLVAIDEVTISGRVQASTATSSIPVSARRQSRQRPATGAANSVDAPWRSNGSSQYAVSPPPVQPLRPLDQEEYLLAHLLRQPELIIWMSTRAQELIIAPPVAEDWQNVENREVYRALKLFLAGDGSWEPELFQESVPEPLHGRLGRLMAQAYKLPEHDPEELRTDMLKVLVRMRIDRLKSDNLGIKFAIDDAQRSGDTDAVRSFDATNNRNLRELNHLQSTLADLTKVLLANGRSHRSIKVR